jgi:hypothetical protein
LQCYEHAGREPQDVFPFNECPLPALRTSTGRYPPWFKFPMRRVKNSLR